MRPASFHPAELDADRRVLARQLKARGSAAAEPDETVRKVLADYASFLAHKIVPLAERYGMTVYVAGVSPPVIEDRCASRTLVRFEDFELTSSLAVLESTANKYLEVRQDYISSSPGLTALLSQKQGISPLPPLSHAHHPHDFATRANMVKRYNTLLASFCARHDCLSYVDINRDLVDPTDPRRRVKRQFLDLEDPTNIQCVAANYICVSK